MEYRCMYYVTYVLWCIRYSPTGLWTRPLVTGHRTLASLQSATFCLGLCVALCSLSHLTYFPITIAMTIIITCWLFMYSRPELCSTIPAY